jgi:hypothetical protein
LAVKIAVKSTQKNEEWKCREDRYKTTVKKANIIMYLLPKDSTALVACAFFVADDAPSPAHHTNFVNLVGKRS